MEDMYEGSEIIEENDPYAGSEIVDDSELSPTSSMTKEEGETDEAYASRSEGFLSDAKEGPGGEYSEETLTSNQKYSDYNLDEDSTEGFLLPPGEEAKKEGMNREGKEAYKDYASGPNAFKKAEDLTADFVPNSQMYDGLSDEDAKKLYEKVKKKSEDSTFLGTPIYKGRVVPAPKSYGGQDSNPLLGVSDLLVDAGRDAIRNTAVTLAAVLDEATINTNINGPTNYAERVDKYMARAPEAVGADSLIKDGSQLVVSAILGGKAGKSVATSAGAAEFGLWARSLSAFGSVVGAVIAQDENAGTLAVGREAYFQSLGNVFKGVPIDEQGRFSTKVIAKKINQLYDAALTVLPAQGVEAVTTLAGKFVQRTIITPFQRFKDPTDKIGEDVLNKLGAGTPEEVKKVVQYIKENREAIVEFSEKGVSDFGFERTTMSAIEEGAKKSGNDLLRVRSMEAEAGAMKRETPNLLIKAQEPGQSMGEMQANVVASKGGLQTTGLAGDYLGEQGIRGIQEAQGGLRAAEENVTQFDESLRKALAADPAFGAQVQKLSQVTGINIGKTVEGEQTESLTRQLVKAVKTMVDKKNSLYEAIPEDAPVDLNSFSIAVMDAKEAGVLPKDLDKIISDNLIGDDGQGIGTDFKFLNNTVLPKLNAHIHSIMNGNVKYSEQQISTLLALRRNIQQDQVQYLIQNGDQETKNAAEAALKYYKDDYLNFEEDPLTPIGAIFDGYHGVNSDIKKTIGTPKELETDRLTRVLNPAQSSIEKLSDKSNANFSQFVKFLDRPEMGEGGRKSLEVIYRGKIFSNISKVLRDTDDITKINPSTLASPLDDVSINVEKYFPEVARDVDTLMNNLRTGKVKLADAKEQLKIIEKQARDEENKVYESALGDFLTKAGLDLPAKKNNSYQVFANLFSQEQSGPKIQQIIDAAAKSEDPLVREGVKSAYVSFLETSFNNSRTGKPDVLAMSKFFDKRNSIWSYGDQVFSDPKDKELWNGYKTAIELTLDEVKKRVPKGIVPTNEGTFNTEAEGALSLAIRMVYGPLSRAGSRWQAGGSRVLKILDPREKAQVITDNIFSDPDYAIQVFTNVANNLEKGLTPQTKMSLFTAGVMLGIYQAKDQEAFMSIPDDELKGYLTPEDKVNRSIENKENVFKAKVPEGVK